MLLLQGSIYTPHHNRSLDFLYRRIHCNYSLFSSCPPFPNDQPHSSQSFEQYQWWLWLAEELPKSSSSWTNVVWNADFKIKDKGYVCKESATLSWPTHITVLRKKCSFKSKSKRAWHWHMSCSFHFMGEFGRTLQLQETPFESCTSLRLDAMSQFLLAKLEMSRLSMTKLIPTKPPIWRLITHFVNKNVVIAVFQNKSVLLTNAKPKN